MPSTLQYTPDKAPRHAAAGIDADPCTETLDGVQELLEVRGYRSSSHTVCDKPAIRGDHLEKAV
jgi:hypothetical protein